MGNILKTLKRSFIVVSSLSVPTLAITTLVSCGISNINKFEYITPIIKDSINLSGKLDFILNNDGSKTAVEKQIQTIIDKNKALVLSNYQELLNNKQNVDVAIKNQSGDDYKWGSQPYSEWSKDLQQANIKTWNGLSGNNPKEMISVDSKMGLKKFLYDNLKTIQTSLGIELSNNQTLKLADVGPSYQKDNILIPLSLKSSDNTNTETKYVLQIPSSCIDLQFKILVIAEPNSSNIIRKEVNVKYDVISANTENRVFANFEDILLDEIQQTSTDKIDVYQTVTDNQILKKLGWINNDIKDHIDGSEIDINILNKDKLLKDLSIDESNLLSIKVSMENRNPTLDGYNGTFNIEANVLVNENKDSKVVTYSYNKSIDESSKVGTPLQLMVPDAYIIQSKDDSKIGQDRFLKMSFLNNKKFGFYYKSSSGAQTIVNGLKLPNTSKRLNALIQEVLDSKKINGSYGINYLINKFDYSSATGNLFIYSINPKQGFSFKGSFEFNNKKYNVNSQTTTAYFSAYFGGIDTNYSFITIDNSSKEEMEKYYETHEYFSKELFEQWKKDQQSPSNNKSQQKNLNN